MYIKSLAIRNILSIESVDIQFKQSGLYLLDGINHDENRRNGAGKSSIWNALVWGIYGKYPRGITASELLRRGADSGSVDVELIANSKTFHIKRERPSKVTITEDGVLSTQETLEKALRLSYEQFVLTVYCPQDTRERFLRLGDKDKKDFLLKLMSLERFEALKKMEDQKIEALRLEIVKLDTDRSRAEGALSIAQTYVAGLDKAKANVAAEEQKVADLESQLRPEPPKPDTSKYDQLQEALQKKYDEMSEAKAQSRMYLQEADRLLAKIKPFSGKDTIDCPSCRTALIYASNSLAVAGDDTLARQLHQQEMDKLSAEAQKLRDQSILVRMDIANETELNALASRIRQSRAKDEQSYWTEVGEINALKGKIESAKSTLRGLRATVTQIEGYANTVESLSDEITRLDAETAKRRSRLTVLTEVSKSLSSTGAPAYTLDSTVDLFNSKVGQYISSIWPNATYELSASKENKDGSVKAKMSDLLTIGGRPCSIGSLSGGEFTALSLAIDLAMFDVLSSQFGIDSNVIIFDEPFTGLDAPGREIVLNLMRSISRVRQVFVVDHATEQKSSFDNIWTVEKLNGVSSLTTC